MWVAARSAEGRPEAVRKVGRGPSSSRSHTAGAGRQPRRPGGLWTTNEPSTAMGTKRSGDTEAAHRHRHGLRTAPGPAPRGCPGDAADRPVANAVACTRLERTPDERRRQQLAGRDHARPMDDTGPGSATGRRRRRPVPPAPRGRPRPRRRPPTRLGGAPAGGWTSPPEVCTAPSRSCWTPPTSSPDWRPGGPTLVLCRGASAPSTERRCGPPQGAAGAPSPAASAGGSTTSASRAPNPVTHRIVDADGDQLDLCDGHATDARTRIISATVIPRF